MDNCKEVLDKILQDTKKKASSKLKVADKKLYEQVLTEMLQAEGVSDATERYIYDGLKFCGAKPLKEYICHAKNPVDVFHRFTRGNLYGKKTTETARMVFSLFGLCLNDQPQEVELLAAIIIRIPTVVMNKENKLDGNAPKYVEQFLKNLNSDVVLPTAEVLNEAGLQMGAMRNFNKFIEQIKGQYDFSKMDIACQKKMAMLENWFVPEKPQATEEQVLQLAEKQAKLVQPVKENKSNDKELVVPQHAKPVPQNDNGSAVDKEDKQAEENVQAILAGYEKKIKELQQLCKQEQQHVERLELEKKSYLDKLAQKEESIENLQALLAANKIELAKLQASLDVSEQNVAEQEKMINVLKAEVEKAPVEFLNSLCSKLRIEYLDFMESEGMDMSIDLGENFRDQLRNVFAICIKAGMKF
ncbi:MAG: hypothetical protein ACI3U2_08915 [Anaerovibrio sp.]